MQEAGMIEMPGEPELEYAKMKEFLSFYVARYFNLEGLPAEKHPIASLEALEKTSMKKALIGLRMAIWDCVEMSKHLDRAEVEKFDALLKSQHVITLSDLMERHSR
jgi:hypothetical protein